MLRVRVQLSLYSIPPSLLWNQAKRQVPQVLGSALASGSECKNLEYIDFFIVSAC